MKEQHEQLEQSEVRNCNIVLHIYANWSTNIIVMVYHALGGGSLSDLVIGYIHHKLQFNSIFIVFSILLSIMVYSITPYVEMAPEKLAATLTVHK